MSKCPSPKKKSQKEKILLARYFDDQKEIDNWLAAFYPDMKKVRVIKREVLFAEIEKI